jgi:hypothetical protein
MLSLAVERVLPLYVAVSVVLLIPPLPVNSLIAVFGSSFTGLLTSFSPAPDALAHAIKAEELRCLKCCASERCVHASCSDMHDLARVQVLEYAGKAFCCEVVACASSRSSSSTELRIMATVSAHARSCYSYKQ